MTNATVTTKKEMHSSEEILYKVLQFAIKLESSILDIDPSIQRALKFQQVLKRS